MSIPVPYLRYQSGFGNEYATEAVPGAADGDDGVVLGAQRLATRQAGLDELDRGDRARAQLHRDLAQRQVQVVGGVHGI